MQLLTEVRGSVSSDAIAPKIRSSVPNLKFV